MADADRGAGSSEQGRHPTLWWAALSLLFAAALWTRVDIALDLEHPGHGDPSFYYDVARNFAQRGRLEIDYIWHYLSPPESIVHPAGDYWMVGSSVLMALPLACGGGLLAAVGVAILFGLLVGGATLILARALGSPRPAAFVATGFVLFEPNLFNFSTSPNAPIFYTAFVTATLAAIARAARATEASRAPAAYAWAGLWAGLAHATRQDGLFLMPAVALAIGLTSRTWSFRSRALLAASGAYLLAMAPLLVSNLVQLGAPLPASLSRTVFAHGYEDIYAYAKPLDWAAYRAWGWDNIWRSKRAALASNSNELRDLLGWGLWLVVAWGVLRSLARGREMRPVVLAGVLLLATQFVFYTFIGTAVATEGGFLKAALALVPFLVTVGAGGLCRASSAHLPRVGPWLVALAIVGLALPRLSGALDRAQRKVRFSNEIGEQVVALRDALEATRRPADPEPVLMTRNPWELHASSGYRAVQVPNDDLATILEVAERYGVTHIVLPVPRSALTLKGAAQHPRLEEVVRLEGTAVRVFRLRGR